MISSGNKVEKTRKQKNKTPDFAQNGIRKSRNQKKA